MPGACTRSVQSSNQLVRWELSLLRSPFWMRATAERRRWRGTQIPMGSAWGTSAGSLTGLEEGPLSGGLSNLRS